MKNTSGSPSPAPKRAPVSPAKAMLLLAVTAFAVYTMFTNWESSLTFWGQKINTVSADFTPEEEYYASQLSFVAPEAVLPSLIHATKPTVLFLHASWCPYCQRMLPTMEALAVDENSPYHVVLLSIDTDPRKFARSLFTRYGAAGTERTKADTPFTPYMLTPGHSQDFKAIMQQAGSKFDGAIPYLAVITPKQEFAMQFRGLVKPEIIDEALAGYASSRDSAE